MAQVLGVGEEVFIQHYTHLAANRAQLSLMEKEDGSCVFLSGNKCIVYDARPNQCRAFPASWNVPGCPGVK